MASLREVGEVETLRRLVEARAMPVTAHAGIAVDAGDDAAVVRPRAGRDLVATTDAFVEGVHYLADWIGGEALGARLAVANLSDLAAMAAEPCWALVSFGARAERDVDDLVAVQRGIASALDADGASIVGGNLTSVAGDEWLSLALVGEVAAGAAWTRAGARPGDLIAVTGFAGRAGAGSRLARTRGDAARAEEWRPLIDAWRAPRSRVAFARALAAEGGVTAAIDVSDGFAGDLGRLCEASGVGATLDGELLPEDSPLEAAAGALGATVDELRFGPSDDYELILALDPPRREACEGAAERLGVPFHVVGIVTEARGRIELRDSAGAERPIPRQGYDHFRPENSSA